MKILRLLHKRQSRRRRVLMFGPATTILPVLPRRLVANAVFRDAFIEASGFVEARRGWSLWDELGNDDPPAGVTPAERNYVQESVLQLALFRAFSATGVEYDAIAGISLGDTPAAHAAGALTFGEALHVLCDTVRALLCAGGGDLIAVQASPARVREVVGDATGNMIVDWPVQSAWAVPFESLRDMQRKLRHAGIPCARLGFNCLSHTHNVDTEGLIAAFASLPTREPARPLYSTLEGGAVAGSTPPRRWARSISEPVKLDRLWTTLRSDGLTDIIYIGSVPVDQDLFNGLENAERPSSFIRAESFLKLEDGRSGAGVNGGAGSQRSDLATALCSPAFARDPYSRYREWLSVAPVHRMGDSRTFAVLGHSAVTAVLGQPAIFSSTPSRHVSPTLLGADPPDHTRMRRLLAPFFSREGQIAQEDLVLRVTAALINAAGRRRAFDAVSDFATKIPVAVASAWLGLSDAGIAALGATAPGDVTMADVQRGIDSDGVIAGMLESGSFTSEEVTLLLPFVIAAGVSTTRDLVLFSMHVLLRSPEVMEAAAADPALIPGIVDEMLRFDPPVHALARKAVVDNTLEGIEIPAGSRLWVFLASANRDPSRFERPDEFIPGRDDSRHVSFGHGPHFCPGRHLGRMEGELVIRAILPELGRLRQTAPPDFVLADMREDVPFMRTMRSWQLSWTSR